MKSHICTNCGEKVRDLPQADSMPGQMLRNQALFPSERMTLRSVVLSGTANEFTGNSATVGLGNALKTYQISVDALRPKRLYSLPHLPLSAYIFIKDAAVFYRGTCTVAHSFQLAVRYVDLTGVDHHILYGGNAPGTSVQNFQFLLQNNAGIIIPATPLNVSEPNTVGQIVIDGSFELGVDTGTFDVVFNAGILYATPESA